MTKRIAALLSLLLLAGCMTTRPAGGYPVFGVVVDKASRQPVAGAKVFLNYYANSFYGDNSRRSDAVLTDEAGAFRFPPQRVRLWGGTGGFAGRINPWPAVVVAGHGYCTHAIGFRDPGPENYQGLVLEIMPREGGNCR